MRTTLTRTRLLIATLSATLLAITSGACTRGKSIVDAGEADSNNITPAYIGGPCATPGDCPVNGVLKPEATACLTGSGGYCAILGCLEYPFPCPGTAGCVPIGDAGPGFCVNPCVDRSDCRPGFECFESVTGFHFCRPIPDDAGTGGFAGG